MTSGNSRQEYSVRPKGWREKGFTLLLAVVLSALALALVAQQDPSERDKWQRPQEIMDALGLHEGSAVADIGAGRGYFTFHFADRVGAQGVVYAVDIRQDRLKKITGRAEKENLPQIQTVHSSSNDPKLPAGSADAMLVMNAYHEFRDYDEMLQGLLRGLKPGGLLAIIDSPMERASSRQTYHDEHDIPREVVKEDAARAGFRFLRELPSFHRTGRWETEFYFLLFEKPAN